MRDEGKTKAQLIEELKELRQQCVELKSLKTYRVLEISEHTQPEKKLRFHNEILNQMYDSVVITDLKGKILNWTSGAEKMWGYSKEEVLGKIPANLLKYKEAVVPSIIEKVKKYGKWIGELTYTRKDGSEGICESLVVLLLDEKGHHVITIGVNRDITERKKAEEELRLNKQTLDHMVEGIHLVNRDSIIIFTNPRCEKMFGYEPGEMIGKHVSILRASSTHYASVEGESTVQAFLLKHGEWSGEVHNRKKDGTLFWTRVKITTFEHSKNGPVFLSVQEDITEHKRAEEQLRMIQERLQLITDSLPAFISYVDKDLRYQFVNQMYLKEFNRPVADFIGTSVEQILGKDFYERLIPQFEKALSGEMVEFESTFPQEGEIIHINAKFIPHEVEGTINGFITLIQDITEEKENQEKIRTALKEKEVLLQEIHHRVKNNMAIITSFIKLQIPHVRHPQDLELFKITLNRIQTMALIHEKLYLSTDFSNIDFGSFTREISNALLSAYGIDPENVTLLIETHEITLDINKAMPCGLIVNELFSNTLKHAFPDGRQGKICVTLHPTTHHQYELKVSDNGVGLPEGFDEKQFFSMGLTIVSQLVEQLKGTLECDGANGTTFAITFPY